MRITDQEGMNSSAKQKQQQQECLTLDHRHSELLAHKSLPDSTLFISVLIAQLSLFLSLSLSLALFAGGPNAILT